MLTLRFKGQYPEAVARELEQLIAAIRTWMQVEHKDDGTHADGVTWATGPWVIGGPETFTDDAYVRLPTPIPTGTYDNFLPERLEHAIIMSLGATGVGGSGPDVILTGLQAPATTERRVLILRNEDNTSGLILMHEDASSRDANRFRLPNAVDLTLDPNESAMLLYDTKWQRWSVVGTV